MNSPPPTLPILYSLRHCPFAMRARLAIYKSTLLVEIRDVKLDNKPSIMLETSPKGTVPIVKLTNGQVIDESLDIMLWALNETDPENLLHHAQTSEDESKLPHLLALIQRYDLEFKPRLEDYKCAKRYHESNLLECREACEKYIRELETRLSQHAFLFGPKESLADLAILPFIRQFAKVERRWYVDSGYKHIKRWLNGYLQSAMFNKVMAPYPIWQPDCEPSLFSQG